MASGDQVEVRWILVQAGVGLTVGLVDEGFEVGVRETVGEDVGEDVRYFCKLRKEGLLDKSRN